MHYILINIDPKDPNSNFAQSIFKFSIKSQLHLRIGNHTGTENSKIGRI
jgi:hypothetical protein